jgi:hypothetical protein
MKRTSGLIALTLVFTTVLAACSGGPSPAETRAWQAGAGEKTWLRSRATCLRPTKPLSAGIR